TEIVENNQEATEQERQERKETTEQAASEGDHTDEQYAVVSEREVTVEETVDSPPAEPEAADDPYGDIDFQSFDNYLNDGAHLPRETEIFENPSFENFLAKAQTLTDHLEWQLGLATVEENARLACHSIIGNLNEDGYLCAVDENGREIPI